MSYVAADTSLPRSIDVQISISQAQTELRTNLTIPCIACEDLGFLPNESRVRFYSTLAGVLADFDSDTEPYKAATAFFSQSPRPTTMAIGEVFFDEQPAQLIAPEYSDAQILAIKAITTGSMIIAIGDGSALNEITISNMDFSAVSTLQGIVNVINSAIGVGEGIEAVIKTLPGGSARLCIRTSATGDEVSIGYAETANSGTFAGTLLLLTEAADAVLCQGYTPISIADELTNIQNAAAAVSKYIFGWCLGSSLRVDAIQIAAAAWALANNVVMSLVTASAGAIDAGISTDIGSVIYDTDNKNVELRYSTYTDEYPDFSMMAYMLSVNYRIQNATVTSKFKVLPGCTPERVTESQWAVLQSKGYNTYTNVGNNAKTNRDGNMAGPGWWYDTVVNLANFVEDLSVNVFNVFLRNKKIPYTRAGQMLLVDACKDVGALYVYNGSFADRLVQDLTQKSGYSTIPAVQVIPTPIYNMTDADRAARVAPPIQMIVQDSGAMHSIAIAVEVVE